MKWVAVLSVLLSSVTVFAAGAAPSVISAPLDVKRSPSAETTAALNKQLRILLMKEPEAITPTPSMWDAAIGEHRRQDCDVSDDCLRQLAVLAGTLYAVYAAVELDVTRTNVAVIGRIVRRDGAVVEVGGERGFKVEMPLQDRPFNVVAQAALTELVKKMKLSALPPTLPATSAEVKPAPGPVDPVVEKVVPPAPQPVIEPNRGSGPLAGKVLLGLGAGVVVAGGGLALVGQLQAGTLTPVDGNLPPSQLGAYRSATTLRPVGVAMMGAGAAVAVAGTLVWLLAPQSPVQAVVVPSAGGATLSIAGEFP